MKVLITGITGFVGSHLVDYLATNEPTVEIFGLCRWRSPLDNIKHCMQYVKLVYGDLTDLSSLLTILKSVQPQVIFHLAAQSYVPFSFDAPVTTLDANCRGTCNLLEAVRLLKSEINYDPIVHICSSSEVYGQVLPEEIPITESNTLRPASPYAVSKVCEDMLGFQYWTSWGIKTIRTRMFTHSGPRRGSVFVESNFAKQIADIERGHQGPVVHVGNLSSVRTFADVRDTVRAYWALVNKCQPGEVYNIGGSTTMTVGEMLDILISLSTVQNIKIEVDPCRLRPSDVTLQIPDCSKFKRQTGWEPSIPFKQTLRDLLDYWRQNN